MAKIDFSQKQTHKVNGETVVMRLKGFVSMHNLSQKLISMDAGMTAAKVSQLLSGKRRLTVADFLTLCGVVGLDPRDVLDPNWHFEP